MNAFDAKLNGMLYGLMHWSDWDALRARIRTDPATCWYAYAVGTDIPETPLHAEALGPLLDEIDALLRNDHDEEYLGIVYVDDIDVPTLVKIYDPNQLGAACGSIGYKVAPGWVLSLDRPSAIQPVSPLPNGRRRWWEGLRSRLIGAGKVIA